MYVLMKGDEDYTKKIYLQKMGKVLNQMLNFKSCKKRKCETENMFYWAVSIITPRCNSILFD